MTAMTSVAVILLAAAAALGLAVWLRTPSHALMLLFGFVVGMSGWLPDPDMLPNILMLGLTFLMFTVGAELDIARVGVHGKAAVRVGLAQFSLLGTLGILLAWLTGFDWHAALYIGLALAASSTLLIIGLLQQRQQLFEPFGRVVVGALLVQDALVVLLLPILMHLGEGWQFMLTQFLGTLGLIGLTLLFTRGVSVWLLIKLDLDNESILLVVLAVLFAFMGIAYYLDIPVVIGAFLAGVALSKFPVNGLVRGPLESLSDFFTAIFFVTLGALITVPEPQQLVLLCGLMIAVFVIATPAIVVVARRNGLRLRSAVETALLLAQCGELGLVVILLGIDQQHVSEDVLTAIVLLVVITMTLTTFISTDQVTWQLMRRLPGTSREKAEQSFADHILFVGCGRQTVALVEQVAATGQTVVVIDDDAGVVRDLRKLGVTAIRGDGADPRVLQTVNAHQAKLIISSMRRLSDHLRLLRFVPGVPVLARVFTPQEGARVKLMGGTAVIASTAAAESFLPAATRFLNE